MDLAQSYGSELLTGVFFRNPNPPPTYGALVRERQESMRVGATPRARILDPFIQQ